MSEAQPDKRLTEYRAQVGLENSVGSLRVFCGGLGLMVLFILALLALLKDTGGTLAFLIRFGKFAFFVVCPWGLLQPWNDYSDKNAKECQRRKEMLARIEQDPDWWSRWESNQSSPAPGTRANRPT